jgi:hypothetical protein
MSIKERALAAKAEADTAAAAEREARRLARKRDAAAKCREWFAGIGISEVVVQGHEQENYYHASFVIDEEYWGHWYSNGAQLQGATRYGEPMPPLAALMWKQRSSFDKATFSNLATLATAIARAEKAQEKEGFEWQ